MSAQWYSALCRKNRDRNTEQVLIAEKEILVSDLIEYPRASGVDLENWEEIAEKYTQ